MAISCVMWDCFNVLIPFDTPTFLAFLKRYSRNCLPPESVFSGAGLNLITRHDTGSVTDADFFLGMKTMFQLDGVSQEIFFSVLGSILRPDREMLKIKSELIKKGIETVLISNMNSFHLNYVKRNFPEFLTDFVYQMISCEKGIAKPDPEAWIKPLEMLGLRAEECIFIDDSIVNVETACSLGIKGWHYNSTDKNWCSTGILDQERLKFKNYLDMLWKRGILRPRT